MISALEKYQAFWPLPGGIENFVDTLRKALAFIKETRPSEEELRKWFFGTFPKVAHEGSVRGFIRTTLWHSGLVDHDKKGHFLTEQGEKYLAKPENSTLFVILDEHVRGFRETLDIIFEKELDMEGLGRELSLRLGMSWEAAYGQPYWRVNWLRSMGFVTLEESRFKLTEPGRKLRESLPRIEPPRQRIEVQAPEKQIVLERQAAPTDARFSQIRDELKQTGHLSQDSSKFESAIAGAFELLGFTSQRLGKPGDTDVLAVAHLGPESYAIAIDGKTTRDDKISERQISWDSLLSHKEKRSADFIAVLAPSFAGGDLIDRAQRHEVTLIETETLIKLLEIHEKTPMDLEDLKELFDRKGIVRLEDCPELIAGKAEYEKQQRLIPRVLGSLYQLQNQKEPTHASDVRWTLGKEFDQEDVLDCLYLLEKWDLVKKVTGEQWITLMPPWIAARRFRAIADSFNQ